MENPIFASSIIKKFEHNEVIDNILFDKLEWIRNQKLGIHVLPIVDQPYDKKRAILRVFITNFSSEPIIISVFYTSVGWFTDLKKFYKLFSLGEITINPGEVWYRDCIVRDLVREGKNYIEFLVVPKKILKVFMKEHLTSQKMEKEVLYHSTEVTKKTRITHPEELERKMYLGIVNKPYISPYASSYWLYYSLYGPYKYQKEPKFLLIFKLILILIGISSMVASISGIYNLTGLLLYLGSIFFIFGFFSLFSNTDKKVVNFCYEAGIVQNPNVASIILARDPNKIFYTKFGDKNNVYGYNTSTQHFYWKTKKDKYIPIILEISKILNHELKIEEKPKIMKVSQEQKEKKKIVHSKISLAEEGIDLNDAIEGIVSETLIKVPTVSIKGETSIKTEIKHFSNLETNINEEVDTISTESYFGVPSEEEMKKLTKDVKAIKYEDIKGFSI